MGGRLHNDTMGEKKISDPKIFYPRPHNARCYDGGGGRGNSRAAKIEFTNEGISEPFNNDVVVYAATI